MSSFIQQYPYLITCLFQLLVYILILICNSSNQRRLMIFSSLLTVPQSMTSLLLIPAYWNPEPVIVILIGIGIEDILFCFPSGGLVWIAASWIVSRKIVFNPKPSLMMQRGIFGHAYFASIWVVLSVVGFKNMDIPLIVRIS